MDVAPVKMERRVNVEAVKPADKLSPVIGKVKCEFLNVRVAPFKDAQPPVTVIKKGDEVVINLKESVAEWYKVTTVEDGITGYCMKKFIER